MLVEDKITAREGAEWNEKLVMKTGIKKGTTVEQSRNPGLDEQGRNLN